MSTHHLQGYIEGFRSVQIKDQDEGGPKSNRNTFYIFVYFYILFLLFVKNFLVHDSACGLNFYDDSGRSPLTD